MLTHATGCCRAVSKEELDDLLQDPIVKAQKMPILFLASKMDLPHCISTQEISERMNLTAITSHAWQIAHCNGLQGTGIGEGIDWIATQLVK